jgi:hypothetical protein
MANTSDHARQVPWRFAAILAKPRRLELAEAAVIFQLDVSMSTSAAGSHRFFHLLRVKDNVKNFGFARLMSTG